MRLDAVAVVFAAAVGDGGGGEFDVAAVSQPPLKWWKKKLEAMSDLEASTGPP